MTEEQKCCTSAYVGRLMVGLAFLRARVAMVTVLCSFSSVFDDTDS